jgi:hypothetical protein
VVFHVGPFGLRIRERRMQSVERLTSVRIFPDLRAQLIVGKARGLGLVCHRSRCSRFASARLRHVPHYVEKEPRRQSSLSEKDGGLSP